MLQLNYDSQVNKRLTIKRAMKIYTDDHARVIW